MSREADCQGESTQNVSADYPLFDIEDVAKTIRDLVIADGGNVHVISANASAVTLGLDVENVECLDCIMPHDFLTNVLQTELRRVAGRDIAVTLIDPRLHTT